VSFTRKERALSGYQSLTAKPAGIGNTEILFHNGNCKKQRLNRENTSRTLPQPFRNITILQSYKYAKELFLVYFWSIFVNNKFRLFK